MRDDTITDDDVAALVERCDAAAAAFIRGDMHEYVRLIKHADDYTLLAPFGGAPRRGFDSSEQALTQLAQFFTAGTSAVELVESYVAGNMVVLVLIERQHGEVGGLPDQEWSLRATLVFRREQSEWLLVHRHADPLVRPISLQLAAQIARGDVGSIPPN